MKRTWKRALSLMLSLVLLLTLLPSAARAEGEEEGGAGEPDESVAGISSVEDVLVKAATKDGHIRFGEASDIQTLRFRNDEGDERAPAAVLSVADALYEACAHTLKGCTFEYVAYISVPGSQGTLYDGYNTEADTGAGVAGTVKYYYSEHAAATNRIQDIRFVPKTTFSGQAIVTYYGYYSYKETVVDDATGRETTSVRRGSYSGRILIEVGKQEPGISYSTDGEAVKFSASDFVTYALATNGRTFNYISFRLPRKSEGALYYNYIDDSIYDYAVAAGSYFYRNSTPLLDRVYFVPAKDYAGNVYIEFNGADSANNPISGELLIRVTNNGPGHEQPRAEGPFAYQVEAGRPVNLKMTDFADETKRQLGDAFASLSFASLPPAETGRLYDDASSGSDHSVRTGVNYQYPEKIRFVAHSGYTGVVSVPIVITGKSGKSFDSMLRFVILAGEDAPLTYHVEPERRVNFIASDFSDACYAATGFDIARVHFDTLPPASAGGLYFNSDPVTTRTSDSYYKEQLDQVGFLANAGFTGTVSIPFTGYAYGYSSSNGRAFHGTVTIVSTETVKPPTPIGGVSTLITLRTTGPAVALNLYEIQSIASAALPDAPATITLTRPNGSAGRLCLDFVSLSHCEEYNAGQSYPISDVPRISFLPKAGFSGTERITYTVRDSSGNSFTGNMEFIVTPPTHSSYFSDMGRYGWAIPAVDFFRYYGATNGTSSSSFGPDALMRRADFIVLLDRMFSFPYAPGSGFADVDPGKYYAGSVAAAAAAGIVSGTLVPVEQPEGGTSSAQKQLVFLPDDAITREEAAVFLYRAVNWERVRSNSPLLAPGSAADLAKFPDAGSVHGYAVEAMAAFVREGVFQGYEHDLLPRRTLSRAEAITILYRALT